MPFDQSALIFAKKTENERGDWIPIPYLMKGDLVKTHKHGYIPIKYVVRSHIIDNNLLQNIGENFHPLIVTDSQRILFDDMTQHSDETMHSSTPDATLDDKVALHAKNVLQFNRIVSTNSELFSFVLDGDNTSYGIYANDFILCESYNKESFDKLHISEEMKLDFHIHIDDILV